MKQEDFTKETKILQGKNVNDADFLRDMVQMMIQEMLETERDNYLKVGPYERNEKRQGYRNGYKPRGLNTRVGVLELQVPQTRDSVFRTKIWDRYQRSEKALLLSLSEMYVCGVSTNKVKKITEKLCGTKFSKGQISRLSKEMDEKIEQWRNRELTEEYPYIYLDGFCSKVRLGYRVITHHILVVIGVRKDGYREIIAVEEANTESEISWGETLAKLNSRGLKGVRLVISDNHEGLKAAIQRYLAGTEWQRCQTHFMKNALDKLPNKEKADAKSFLREVFDSAKIEQARTRIQEIIKKYEKTYPTFSDFIDENIEDTLSVFNFPEKHRIRLRTTNPLERLNEEFRRRVRVVRIFPNPNSLLRLICAISMEISEDWSTGHRYLDMRLLYDSVIPAVSESDSGILNVAL